MKVYKTQQQIEADIKDGVLAIEGDVDFECSFFIPASIIVRGGNIYALNIRARDIYALNIYALDIDVWDIDAGDINARGINAFNIYATNINAGDISYHAFCCVYGSIVCSSIKARRGTYKEPICLDGELKIRKESSTNLELLKKVEKLIKEANKLKKEAENIN